MLEHGQAEVHLTSFGELQDAGNRGGGGGIRGGEGLSFALCFCTSSISGLVQRRQVGLHSSDVETGTCLSKMFKFT